MKGTVEIGAGVRHHLNLPNLKLSSGSVVRARLFATEKVADEWGRQAFVRDQAVLEGVTKIDETHSIYDSVVEIADGSCEMIRPPSRSGPARSRDAMIITREYFRASLAGSDRACSRGA